MFFRHVYAELLQHLGAERTGALVPQVAQNISCDDMLDGTVRKAKILAARRATSISRLLADEIEALVAAEDQYECAERAALALLANPAAQMKISTESFGARRNLPGTAFQKLPRRDSEHRPQS